ncbi:leucyl-tRNA synthetase [Bacteroidetes bacterium UKL13-3]|nr:leucyl-tRNA synthetase [Bacteroidetes bacterium UKL13-3]HCP93717.1 leucine--tRNA ligase [Bacteroidota bacterium]
MKEYDFKAIEQTWQDKWRKDGLYKVSEHTEKPKCYVLDMFPYPSGAGLHVGHPLGYIASDIYARYKRLKGYNVLHPMGYDSFGLPAEQYAIQTGQHPAITTEKNIARYRKQLDKIGFCYDWSCEVRTSDPSYYKWTQWIFIQLYNSWYNPHSDKAENIETLIQLFEKKGFSGVDDTILTGGIELDFSNFTATEWKTFDEEQKQKILLGFRLAYLSEAFVNWCPQLGTVLSNDEVKDGVSERGGYPVERKLMNQWSMRITAYADRLLKDLEGLEWSESLKETQRNWIGKSQGASIHFNIQDRNFDIEVFTTRPDTIFGVSYLAVAPEYEFLDDLLHPNYMDDVMDYVDEAKNRSERERLADVKRISGAFTGMYAVHPFTGQEIPIWVADYVLAGYGTGAVMAVPAHDSRDFAFAKHFDLPILPVLAIPQGHDLNTESYDAKEGKLTNSDFLNGLDVKDAIKKAIEYIEKRNIGKGKTNFRLRDAIFGRQRYWGEPIPVYYKNGIPYCLPEDKLPLELPAIDKFLPTEDGDPPLARAEKWMWDETKQEVSTEGFPIETTTMPGWAGSSWYFLRYMDPTNQHAFASKEAVEYWKNVDLYLGGSEHATGHLLYVRFWTKFLYDRGFIPVNEPAQKLINQGMIQGRSNKISRLEYGYHGAPLGDQSSVLRRNIYVTKEIGEKIENGDLSDVESFLTEIINKDNPGSNGTAHPFNIRINRLNVDVNIVKNDLVSLNDFRNSITGSKDAVFLGATDDKIECSWEVEKMSKSKYNIVTPDNIVEDYGADTLRLYEMFLGPLEQSKPWSTQGIEGVHRFLKKLWKLFYNQEGNFIVSTEVADKKELKVLHKLIKKVGEDIENFSFNTSVPAFMICVNELIELKSSKKEILENVVICLSPYAPHIAEELWAALGNKDSVFNAQFPIFNAQFLVEDTFSYPISINGKHRMNMEMSLTLTQPEVEQLVLADEGVQKWLEGKTPKKIIFVKGKIVNMVL